MCSTTTARPEMRDDCGMAERVTGIAAELQMPLDRVVADLLDHITVRNGRREVADEVCAGYVAEVQARRAAAVAAVAARAAEAALEGHPLREHVRAIQRRQEALGEPVDGHGAALGRMLESDGARDVALDRAARDRAEQLSPVVVVYHRIEED